MTRHPLVAICTLMQMSTNATTRKIPWNALGRYARPRHRSPE